jgi:lycopene cyclase domain-containing protein
MMLVVTLVFSNLFSTEHVTALFTLNVYKIIKVKLFETHYLYWYIHIFTFVPVFLLSFDKKVHFYKKWKYLWQGLIIVGTVFIIWDMGKTYLQVWTFNPKYVVGIYLYNLPIEELMFFVTVPYACLFIYECLNVYFPFEMNKILEQFISWILFVVLIALAIDKYDKTYTFVTCVICVAYLAYHLTYESAKIRGRFYFAFMVTMVPFLLVDGVLTGAFTQEPIIIYNINEFMDRRIVSVPIEDAIYLIPLMLGNVTYFEVYRRKHKHQLRLEIRASHPKETL